MPHSPFTRFLGAVIVALFAFFLLWTDDRAHEWGLRAAATLPLLIGIFTWTAVRGAAPFDDRSFHRTLPPGDGPAFGRVLMIHGLVLGGIALVVLIYCGIFNLGWRAASYGIAVLTLPVMGWMAVMGLAASLGISSQHGKIWSYIAIFASPLFGWGLMQWYRSGFDPEWSKSVYFPPERTMILTGAIVYPLIWWLVAVKRRRVPGMVFAAWTGFLLPWLSIYGDFIEAPSGAERHEQWEREVDSKASKITLIRKAVPEVAEKWIDVDQLLAVEGLGEKETVSVGRIRLNDKSLGWWEVRDESLPREFSVRFSGAEVGKSGGRIIWGDQALWDDLASKLPPHETLRYWTEPLNLPARVAMLNPGFNRDDDLSLERLIPRDANRRVTADELRSLPWEIWMGSPKRWEKVAEYDVAKGGTLRLPEGGILRVDPLHQEGDHYSITFKRYSPSFEEADGPWFDNMEQRETPFAYPRVLLVDETGKHVFIVDPLSYDQGKFFMLAERTQWTFYAGASDTPENAKRMEMLRSARIHVFWPTITGRYRKVTLPPP